MTSWITATVLGVLATGLGGALIAIYFRWEKAIARAAELKVKLDTVNDARNSEQTVAKEVLTEKTDEELLDDLDSNKF